MNGKLFVAIALGAMARFANAGLNECMADCATAYTKCIEDRNPLEACQLAQKNCETECRK